MKNNSGSGMLRTVSEVAQVAHVTVRALHHYDALGLLSPSQRSPAGYRLYAPSDLQRLQQILVFRQLDFSLDAIGPLIDGTVYARRQALEAQRALLIEQQAQTEAVIRGVDLALTTLESGDEMKEDKMFEGFGDFDPSKYGDEVAKRWGGSEAYTVSMRRTKQYSKADWARIKEEEQVIYAGLIQLLTEGISGESSEAMAFAEQHRLHIDRWFYPCNHEMHMGLAEMYTADDRFSDHFEKQATGFSAFIQTAILANGVAG